MDHVIARHVEKCPNKSLFVKGVNVKKLIREALAHPQMVKQHQSKARRKWYFGECHKVIGYRGTDGAKCKWIAVLMDCQRLITAYPIIHPTALRFMQHQ